MSQTHDEMACLRRNLNAMRLDLALVRARMVLKTKYSADQPRVPSGNPDGGQWTSGDGGGDGSRSSSSRTGTDTPTRAGTRNQTGQSILLAGGFTKEQLNLSVQEFT